MAGSGVLWNMMLGFLGSSTDREADHDVSPLSELAVQVYRAVSSRTRSKKAITLIVERSCVMKVSTNVKTLTINHKGARLLNIHPA